ncbi:MAG: sulfide/dihydroorotate dehydrogenase-like FAD/NAD-binding protein [Planctomycetota bacterium]|nr:sulfide/dihydroorotate dehydrogenase-like FAD/NAD-binding protein [Planctomycetota bacterium]
MNEVLEKRRLGPDVFRMELAYPKLARKARPGQFVIVRASEDGERIPLTIADADPEAGSITLIFQVVGKSTTLLARMEPGDEILDVVGPLGVPTEIERFGRVLCIGGGIGAAPLYPIAKALKAAGNTVTTILGGRSKNLVILENEFRAISDAVVVTTDDGSHGRKGFVTDALKDLLGAGERFDRAWAIGPVPMMKAVCDLARGAGIPTVVSLNPIMVDGTGMCGGCRVIVDGHVKFACVDGPEFDGHRVDFDTLAKRLTTYRDRERRDHEVCKIGLDTRGKRGCEANG